MNNGTILWVDDDRGQIAQYAWNLQLHGYTVVLVQTLRAARNWLDDNQPPALVVIDIHIRGENVDDRTNGGIELAAWIRKNHPALPMLGVTIQAHTEQVAEFRKINPAFLKRTDFAIPGRLISAISEAIKKKQKRIRDLEFFIVHGTDDAFREEAISFLKRRLKVPSPKVLMDLPSGGRTIIEKFEYYATNVDVALILLSPEDTISTGRNDRYRQPRPNVVFEIGYFMALMGRLSGRVLLLFKDNCRINTDLSGVVYINVSTGIRKKEKAIRNELARILKGGLHGA